MPDVDQALPPAVSKLTTRACRVLAFLVVKEPSDLLAIDWMKLAKVRGCGRKTIREIAIWGGADAAHIAEHMSERERAYWTASLAAQVRP